MLPIRRIFGFRKNTSKRLRSLAGENQKFKPGFDPPLVRNFQAELLLTPAGGIPARTGTGSPWTPGVATCTLCEYYEHSGTLKIRTTSWTGVTANMTPTAIDGNILIQAKYIRGRLTIDVDQCNP